MTDIHTDIVRIEQHKNTKIIVNMQSAGYVLSAHDGILGKGGKDRLLFFMFFRRNCAVHAIKVLTYQLGLYFM